MRRGLVYVISGIVILTLCGLVYRVGFALGEARGYSIGQARKSEDLAIRNLKNLVAIERASHGVSNELREKILYALWETLVQVEAAIQADRKINFDKPSCDGFSELRNRLHAYNAGFPPGSRTVDAKYEMEKLLNAIRERCAIDQPGLER